MRQFIDYFISLQQWDAGAYFAGLAIIAMLGIGAYAFCWFVQAMMDLYSALAEMRERDRD